MEATTTSSIVVIDPTGRAASAPRTAARIGRNDTPRARRQYDVLHVPQLVRSVNWGDGDVEHRLPGLDDVSPDNVLDDPDDPDDRQPVTRDPTAGDPRPHRIAVWPKAPSHRSVNDGDPLGPHVIPGGELTPAEHLHAHRSEIATANVGPTDHGVENGRPLHVALGVDPVVVGQRTRKTDRRRLERVSPETVYRPGPPPRRRE